MITQEQFNNWLQDPVTKELKKVILENMTKIAYGTQTEAFCRDQIGRARESGKFEAHKFFRDLRLEDLTGS